MAEAKGSSQAVKRTLIEISSSSAFSEEDNALESDSECCDTSSESKSDDSVEEITSSTSCDEEDDDDCFDEYNERIEEESICGRVVNIIRGKNDLQELTLVDCKAYLRMHGLRLSGTKAECILRIQDHWRLKDGIGETLYPRSSFTINCTGDVCRGDVVLFTQNVYRRFDKVTRRGSPLRKRTIAGRIVKESYGAAKQQHTFTIEVLWSKGINNLPPVFPLLVKGRNLYRLTTYRQPWDDENERSKVLAEKHRRGAAARSIREMRRTIAAAKRRQKMDSTKESTRKAVFPRMQGDN